jgi:hypothetical protein
MGSMGAVNRSDRRSVVERLVRGRARCDVRAGTAVRRYRLLHATGSLPALPHSTLPYLYILLSVPADSSRGVFSAITPNAREQASGSSADSEWPVQ